MISVDAWEAEVRQLVAAINGAEQAAHQGVTLTRIHIDPPKKSPRWEWQARCYVTTATGATADAAMTSLRAKLEEELAKRLEQARTNLAKLEQLAAHARRPVN